MKLNPIARLFKGREKPATRLMAVTPPRTGERILLGVENLLGSVAVPEPFSLEIAGDSGGVTLLARCREGSFVRQQLGVHYPQARVNEVPAEEDPLRLKDGEQAWSMDMGLRGPEYLPLRTFRDDDLLDQGSDPLISVIGSLSDLEEGERVVSRIKLASLGPDWSSQHLEKTNPRPVYDPNTSPSTTQGRIDRTNAGTLTILALLALPALKAYFLIQSGETWKAGWVWASRPLRPSQAGRVSGCPAPMRAAIVSPRKAIACTMVVNFFRQPHRPGRDKFLSRLFGIFNEEVVRAWCSLPGAKYQDVGRPYLKRSDEKRGHTLDFTLRERATDKLYIAEMKCELEYEGYRYLRLESPEQVRHHEKNGVAFRKFLEVARNPISVAVTVNQKPVEISGSVLVWGAASPQGAEAVRKAYELHDLLTIEDMLPPLRANPPAEWSERIKELRAWSMELFDFLLTD